MKKAVVSLSFDDARGDNTEAFEQILFPRGLPVTLNVTTGYVDGSIPAELSPCPVPAMTVDEVKRIYASGYAELALHGDTHQNTEADMQVCRKKLIEWLNLPENTEFGIASPKSQMDLDGFIHAQSGFYRDRVRYLRSGLRITGKAPLRILFRKMGRVWHRPEFYRIAYRDTIMHECSDRVIYAVPVLGDITLAQVKAIVDTAAASSGAVCLMFHSIAQTVEPGDNWTWSRTRLTGLGDYLQQLRERGTIDVVTTAEMYERLCRNPAAATHRGTEN